VRLVNSGTVDAVLSALTLTGDPVTTQDMALMTVEDSDAFVTYNGRGPTLKLQSYAMSDIQDAFYVAALELNRHGIPRGHVLQLDYLRQPDGTQNAHLFGWTSARGSVYRRQNWGTLASTWSWASRATIAPVASRNLLFGAAFQAAITGYWASARWRKHAPGVRGMMATPNRPTAPVGYVMTADDWTVLLNDLALLA